MICCVPRCTNTSEVAGELSEQTLERIQHFLAELIRRNLNTQGHREVVAAPKMSIVRGINLGRS